MSHARPHALARRRLAALAALGAVLALAAQPVVAAVATMPFEEVRSGMRGTGRTVFSGTEIESFDVEILGTLRDVAPDRNLILARLSGGPLERTGVMAGMSGSPVTVDGRLIGAVAYSWGFSKEPIAGITPIEEMLAIAADSGPGTRSAIGVPTFSGLSAAALDGPAALDELEGAFAAVARRSPGAFPASMPLAVTGLGPTGLDALEPLVVPLGLRPVQAGSAASTGEPGPALRPGAAIGLQLVGGDIEMTATGTATWVDGDDVLALGHPLFGLGALEAPLTGARVEALLPSLHQSARLATPLATVGALRQDRQSGVLGRIGASPRTIPVRVQHVRAGGDETTYSFDVVDDPLLAPLLLYASLNGILAARDRAVGSTTVRLADGSIIKMADGEDVLLDNVYAGPDAFRYGTGIPAYLLYLLMNNAWSPPRVAGVNLIVQCDDLPRRSRIARASVDRYRVSPGETVTATVVLSPYRGAERVVSAELELPESTPPGPLTLLVGGALAIARQEADIDAPLPRDLDELVGLINRLRRNDRVYLQATREDSGVALGSARLPSLPRSVAHVLTRPRSGGLLTVVPRRSVLEDVIVADEAVEGAATVRLEVVAP